MKTELTIGFSNTERYLVALIEQPDWQWFHREGMK